MDALPIIPNSVGRYPTYLKGAPLWSLTTDRLGGWTLWRYNVHLSSIAIVIFKRSNGESNPDLRIDSPSYLPLYDMTK